MSTHHTANGASEDTRVEAEALVAQVEELVLELLEGVALAPRVAVLHLGPASEAGADAMAQVVEGDLPGELAHVLRLLGSGADDREIAPQDVEDLGQLVEMGAAQDVAERRDPGVVLGGRSRVGKRSFVGLGAVVVSERTVGDDAVVGAGAVVVRDVPPGVTVAGVPAKPLMPRPAE